MATDFRQSDLAAALGQELQDRLSALFARRLPLQQLIIEIERLFLDGFQPLLEAEFYRKIVDGWIRGAVDVLKLPGVPDTKSVSMFPPIEPPDLINLLFPGGDDDDAPRAWLPAIENAARRLLERRVVSSDDFRQLGAAARREAFTISGDLTEGAIEDVRNVLADEIREGASLDGFGDRLRERMDGRPIGLTPAHLENVFRSNVLEAYSQGHEEILEHPMVKDAFPFRLYSATHDARARKNHLALEKLGLDGTAVYWAEDPVWLRFRPPWDYQCRCGWIALDVESAARYGVKAAQEWLATGIEPRHEFVRMPDFAPSASWERMAVAV